MQQGIERLNPLLYGSDSCDNSSIHCEGDLPAQIVIFPVKPVNKTIFRYENKNPRRFSAAGISLFVNFDQFKRKPESLKVNIRF